jgi:hypothetical protein
VRGRRRAGAARGRRAGGARAARARREFLLTSRLSIARVRRSAWSDVHSSGTPIRRDPFQAPGRPAGRVFSRK